MESLFQDIKSMDVGTKVIHKLEKWHGIIEATFSEGPVFVRWTNSGIGTIYDRLLLSEVADQGDGSNGSILVSKTSGQGSNPCSPAT